MKSPRSVIKQIEDKQVRLKERYNELKGQTSELKKAWDVFVKIGGEYGKSAMEVMTDMQEEVSPEPRRSGRLRKRTRQCSPNGDSPKHRKRRKIPEETLPSSDADDEEDVDDYCMAEGMHAVFENAPRVPEEESAPLDGDEEEEEPKKDSDGGDTTEKENNNRYKFEWSPHGFLNTGWRYEGFEKVDCHGDVLCERCNTPLTYVHTLVHPHENNRKIRIGCICAFWCCEDKFDCPCGSCPSWTKGVRRWKPVAGTDREKCLKLGDDKKYPKCFLIVFPARVDEYGWKWEVGTTPHRKDKPRYQCKQKDPSFHRTRREAYELGLTRVSEQCYKFIQQMYEKG